jgi:branched-chain amino acid transport system ATP-binding protein
MAGNLPHGQQRLLELARSMATKPKLILLDEPAAGLNPHEQDMLREALRSVVRSGITLLLVEHHMRLVMTVSDWVHVLDTGCKIAEGSPKEIGKNPVVVKAYLGKEY